MADNIKTPQSEEAHGAAPSEATKKSWYQRYMDAKTGRNVKISDEDLKKYTGMTKAELEEWAKDRPGVAANQPAGKLTVGPATGFGGYETAHGYGGWGPSAGSDKLKFPPQKQQEGKKLDDEDDN
ncbi:hypothetical protein QBC46DRAFT_40791 [Diplogelasinospora grovesii]|uniref:Uncharacterized protein n=1 Tax=Diplogelasinospora grovesii TaxID=303347 RepID=A0AAN6S0F6_9PEZI|nr:hypothetical protein QBC46DRAFT_40791 [Diplogelasinospora grovesii]